MYLRALLRRWLTYVWPWRLRSRRSPTKKVLVQRRLQGQLNGRPKPARQAERSATSERPVKPAARPVAARPAPASTARSATRGSATEAAKRQLAATPLQRTKAPVKRPTAAVAAAPRAVYRPPVQPREQVRRQVEPPPAVNRIVTGGYPCALSTSCHALSARLEEPWPACVRNLSRDALKLVMKRRFEPGTFLRFDLENPSSCYSRTFFARVVQARAEGTEWALECALSDCCDEEEMQALLA